MQLASLFPFMSPALTDVWGTKRLPLCFPTFISKNPVCRLLTPHLRACCLRQFHGTLKPSPVDVNVPWDTQCALFSFGHKNVTTATWSRGRSCFTMHDALSCQNPPPPQPLLGREPLYLRIFPAYPALVPRMTKYEMLWKILCLKIELPKWWEPRLFVFESRFLAFKPVEKNLDLPQGNMFSQAVGEKTAVVWWPRKNLSCPLESDRPSYQERHLPWNLRVFLASKLRMIRTRSSHPYLMLHIFKSIRVLKVLKSAWDPVLTQMGAVTLIKRALVKCQAFPGLGKLWDLAGRRKVLSPSEQAESWADIHSDHQRALCSGLPILVPLYIPL